MTDFGYVRVGETACPVCEHDAEDHAGGHGDDRLDRCQVPGCDCQGPFADDPNACQVGTLKVYRGGWWRPGRESPHFCCVCDMPAVAAELGQWYCNAHRSGQ